MAVLTAIEHPEIVAGLVLLDPTPINDAAGCARLERVFTAADRLTGVAPVHALMRAGLRRGMRRSMRRTQLRPECAEALEKIANLDISRLAASVRGISRLSAEFPQQLPQLPAVMVTADRKPKLHRPVPRAAGRCTRGAAGWTARPTNLQLDHPEETLANVRQLIARTRLAA